MFDNYIQAETEGFKGELLDHYLALGYFRMHDEMFTTQSIASGKYGNDNLMENVFWLRTVVPSIIEKKSIRNLRKKCSGLFITRIGSAAQCGFD